MTAHPGKLLHKMLLLGSPSWKRLALSCGLGVAGSGATLGLLAGSGYLVDRAAFRPGLGAIAGLLALVEVLAFVRAPLRYGERLASHDVAMRALVHWRVWLFDRLEPLAPAGLRHWRSGDLLTRAIDDVDTLQDLYIGAVTPIAVTTTISTLAVVAVAVLLPLAGVILGVALVVALVVPSALAFLNGSSDAREATLRGELSADVVDLLQGAPELLAFGRQAAALANIDDTDAAIARLSRRRGAVAAWASAIVSVCAGGAVVAILAAAVSAFGRHHLGAGLVAALPLAAVGAFEAVPPFVAAAHRTSRLLAAGERLVALASIPAPVLDPPDPEPLPPGHGVAIHRARLRYGEDLPWALDGLSMRLEPGERVAITGPSGAGKSSLANVLLRFWGLAEGRATLGGVPLDHLAQADVRRVVGLVDQEARLFAGSVRYNVTLARPRADDQEVRRVLGLAQLTGWIDSLPEGTDTPVGEEGGRLSGGQRQRIALARTLLADPAVLILDEPTAGLDQPVARALLEDLMAASEGRSVLLITHDADDAAGCDRIVMIDAGRVVDRS